MRTEPHSPAQEAQLAPEVLEEVRRIWGFDALRPLQAEAIAAGIAGRDSLLVMPTGGGKSLCYQVPPLAARRADIPPLAELFLERACARLGRPPVAIAADAMHRLLQHDWPGNVRELRHVLEVAAATLHEPVLRARDLPASLALPGEKARGAGRPTVEPGAHGATCANDASPSFRRLDDEVRELERARIAQALVAAGGVRTKAAALIGMPLRTFLTKMTGYGLQAVARDGTSSPARPRG